jgi:hypothetical protein
MSENSNLVNDINNLSLVDDINAEFEIPTIMQKISSLQINPISQILNNRYIDETVRSNLGLECEKAIREFINSLKSNSKASILNAMNILDVTDPEEINWKSNEYMLVDGMREVYYVGDKLQYKQYSINLETKEILPYKVNLETTDNITVIDQFGNKIPLIKKYISPYNVNLFDLDGNTVLLDGHIDIKEDWLVPSKTEENIIINGNQPFELTVIPLQSVEKLEPKDGLFMSFDNQYINLPLFMISNNDDDGLICFFPTYLDLSEYKDNIFDTVELLQSILSVKNFNRLSLGYFKKHQHAYILTNNEETYFQMSNIEEFLKQWDIKRGSSYDPPRQLINLNKDSNLMYLKFASSY